MLSTRDPFQNKGHIQTESEGLEKDISHKQRPKESRSNNTHKIDFKTKAVKRHKEGHYIMIKGSIQEEDITIQIPITSWEIDGETVETDISCK